MVNSFSDGLDFGFIDFFSVMNNLFLVRKVALASWLLFLVLGLIKLFKGTSERFLKERGGSPFCDCWIKPLFLSGLPVLLRVVVFYITLISGSSCLSET